MRSRAALKKSASHVSTPFFGTKAARASSFFGPSLQRKPGAPPDKVQIAKDELKAKYGVQDFSEMGGVAWTEYLLKKLGSSFSRMSADEQKRLKGVTFVLRDKFPPAKLKGKDFSIAGTTYGTTRVELTASGVRGTVLHEAGHLMHFNAIANAEILLDRSQIKADLDSTSNAVRESARLRFNVPADQPYAMEQINAVMEAAAALQKSSDAARKANRDALVEAELLLPIFKPDAASNALAAHVAKVRAYVVALLRWSDEKDRVVASIRRLDEFVRIVKKDRLARRSAIFTTYAEANWPDSPVEFFAEAYAEWRRNPSVVKALSKDLAAWFEKGGHLGPKLPPDRPEIKIPIPTQIPALHKDLPVMEELLLEMGQTFLPAIEGGVNIVDVVVPLPVDPKHRPVEKN